MTPHEYDAAVVANRIFGRQQVRQQMRALAAEYGLDPAILDPPKRPHRPIRLVPDTQFEADLTAARRSWIVEQYMAAKVQRREPYAAITGVAS